MSEQGTVSDASVANRVVLEGVLLKTAEFRFTPAGRPVATLELEHRSWAVGMEPALKLELHIPVVAVGPLAEWCRRLVVGDRLRVDGRLNQRRWIRDGKVRWGRTELVARDIRRAGFDAEAAGDA